MQQSSDLVELGASQLRRLIGAKKVSPVELLEACIARVEALNPAVNAIAATEFDVAFEAARRAECMVMSGAPLGLLHGLPMGIKDLENTAGLLTTYGSPTARGYIPDRDVSLVERLRRAGGIVVAKTNVPEFGAGANTRNVVWGATGNPFNPLLNAGGSSGGSAAALACDMFPICTGSDTGGSLRIPASLCGVVGFRPSAGLVPNSRRKLGWSPISVVGPMGRTVEEAALQLAATAGWSNADPLSLDVDPLVFTRIPPVDLSSLRVAYTEDFGCCDIDAPIRRVFQSRMEALAPHVMNCEPVAFNMGAVHKCFDILRAQGFVAGLGEMQGRNPRSIGENVQANLAMGASMSLADCAWAQAEQTAIFQRFQTVFERFDVVLSPTTPVSPFPWKQFHATKIDGNEQENYYRWLALTYVVTVTTHPAVSLPCGVDDLNMPFGLQVTGPFRADLKTLAASSALEALFSGVSGLGRPRPDFSQLKSPVPALTSIVTHSPMPHGSNGPSAEVSVV